MREISVLLTPSLVLPTVNTRSIFSISINSSAYPATAPQVQVSPDTRAERIDNYSDFPKSTYNCLNTISQTIPIVNAYDSSTTQPNLKIFDKAFNKHAPPSSKVSYSVGCPTLKPKTTRRDISFNSPNKADILVYCSMLNNPTCLVVTRASTTITQWTAIVGLANQYRKGQGHNPLQIDPTIHRTPERTNYRKDSATLVNGDLSFSTLSLTPVPVDRV